MLQLCLTLAQLFLGGSQPDPIAMVLDSSGNVQILTAEGKARTASRFSLIFPSDQLETSAESQLLLVFLRSGHRERLREKVRVTVSEGGCDPGSAVDRLPIPKRNPKTNLPELRDGTGAAVSVVLRDFDAEIEDFIPQCLAIGAIKPVHNEVLRATFFTVRDPDKLRRAWPGLPVLSRELIDSVFAQAIAAQGEEFALFLLEKQPKAVRDGARNQAYKDFLTARLAERSNDLAAALKGYEQARELDDLAWQATCLDNVGNVATKLRSSAKAIAAHSAALDIRERLYGVSPETAMALRQLSDTYRSFGDRRTALALSDRAYRMADEIVGTIEVVSAKTVDTLKHSPVELSIYYNDEPVVPAFDKEKGIYTIPQPLPQTKIAFRVKRRDDRTTDRYGLVLMVNGFSTLDMEQKLPLHCRRWVIEDSAAYRIQGLYKNGFVLSIPYSGDQAPELKLRENFGLIAFHVFKESKSQPTTLPPNNAQEIPQVGVLPPDQRGGALRSTTFRNPELVLQATIRYLPSETPR